MNLQETINWRRINQTQSVKAGPDKIKNQDDQKIRIIESRP